MNKLICVAVYALMLCISVQAFGGGQGGGGLGGGKLIEILLLTNLVLLF